MGTFHEGKSELHGITIVVDTDSPTIYVGRCDDENEHEVILLDADHHEDGTDGKSKTDWLKAAAKFGIWKKHDRISIPRAEVSSIQRLGEIAG